jgi:hypothetical protein
MFMALYALAVSLLVLGVLWAEYLYRCLTGRWYMTDNALTRALDAWGRLWLGPGDRDYAPEAAE